MPIPNNDEFNAHVLLFQTMLELRREGLRSLFTSAMDSFKQQIKAIETIRESMVQGTFGTSLPPLDVSVREEVARNPMMRVFATGNARDDCSAAVILGFDELLQELSRNLYFTTVRRAEAGPRYNGVPFSEIMRFAGNAVRHYFEWRYDTNLDDPKTGSAMNAEERRLSLQAIDAASPPLGNELNVRKKEAEAAARRRRMRLKSLEGLQRALGTENPNFVAGGLPFAVLYRFSEPDHAYEDFEQRVLETANDLFIKAMERDQAIAARAPNVS